MACFGTRYGPFRMPIWCILQCVKIPLKHKSLLFSCLRKVLITRGFAPEGKSVRKYSLIFRGISGNSGAKTEIRLRFESCPYRFLSERRGRRLSVINAAVFIGVHIFTDFRCPMCCLVFGYVFRTASGCLVERRGRDGLLSGGLRSVLSLSVLSEQRHCYAPFQSAQLGQSAQTSYARIAGVGVFAQVVYHLMAVVGAHRY